MARPSWYRRSAEKLAGQGFGERPAVENARQWVVHGLVGERIARLHQAGLQLD